MSTATSTSIRTGKIDATQPIKYPGLKPYEEMVAENGNNDEAAIPSSSEIRLRHPMLTELSQVPGGPSPTEVEVIKRFGHTTIDAVGLTSGNKEYPRIFLTALSKVHSREFRQYLFALLDRLLQDAPSFAEDFWQLKGSYLDQNQPLPISPLLAILRGAISEGNGAHDSTIEAQKTRLFLIAKSSAILTALFAHVDNVPVEDQEVFIPLLKSQCEHGSAAEKMISLRCLHQLLSIETYQVIFWHQQGIEMLQSIIVPPPLEGPKNIQRLYLAVKCLWIMSFNSDIQSTIANAPLISNLVDILKVVKTPKVVRLTLGTLRNLATVGKTDEWMISYGMMRCLDRISSQKWGDEDVESDLASLAGALEAKVNDLSSFDEYKYELASGKLDWSSPTHKSERFWRNNINRFDEQDFYALNMLRDILLNPASSPTVLSIACWDVGEVIRHHPQRKYVLQKVDLKMAVMALLNHQSEEVKKESLLALQKIMVTNWESLQ